MAEPSSNLLDRELGHQVCGGWLGSLYYLDVTHPVANKGSVVDFLSKVYLLPASSIATIGDMPNDVLMFERSGMSIAMGNASEFVKGEANFVTYSNEEEGFAHAIERFVLNQTSSSSVSSPASPDDTIEQTVGATSN